MSVYEVLLLYRTWNGKQSNVKQKFQRNNYKHYEFNQVLKQFIHEHIYLLCFEYTDILTHKSRLSCIIKGKLGESSFELITLLEYYK